MKQGWEIKKLGDVCKLMVDGDWIESKDQSDDGIRLLQTGNVGIGCFKDKSEHYKFISEETFDRLNCTEIFEGDILISRLPEPIGRACIVPALNCRLITAVDCTIIRLKNIVLPRYVVYYTRSNKYSSDIEQYVTGAVRKRISRSNLAKIPIPVPERAEQERIVGELDCLSGIIANKRAQLRELDTLAQSIFYTMFGDPITNDKGWQTKKWGDLLTIVNGKNQKKVICENGKYPIYGSGGIMGWANDYLCPQNTVIIGRKGNINKPLFVKEKFWNVDTAFGLVANKEILIPYFLFFFCQMYNFEQHNKAVTIPSLTKSDLLNIQMPCPDIDSQIQFAEKIEHIEEQKQLIKASIAETEDLFNSRMSYYFN